MNSASIRTIIVLTISIFFALYLGIASATAQTEAVAWIVGGSTLAMCIWMGRKIYLLMPLFTTMGLVLPLPGNLPMQTIGEALFIGFFMMLFLLRAVRTELRPTALEFMAVLTIITVLQVYMRNPVGVSIIGSGSVGGKRYFLFYVTALAAALLCTLKVESNEVRWWAKLWIAGALINFLIGALGFIFPSASMLTGASFATDIASGQEGEGEGPTRISFVRTFGTVGATWIISKVSPLKLALSPLWALAMLACLAMVTFSGFRSQLILVMMLTLGGIYYHSRFFSFIISIFGGVMFLAVVSLVNIVAPLPPNIQRAFSFLPGSWDQKIADGAQKSTDWRVEMWKEALTSEEWIKNKVIGDGMGFTNEELQKMQAYSESGVGGHIGRSGLTIQQESLMINGSYHSGPVQTIRITGYVGLFVLLSCMGLLAYRSHRLILLYRNTEWQHTVMFLCLPLIVQPFYFVLVFGTFATGMSTTLFGIALVRLMERCLPLSVQLSSYQSSASHKTHTSGMVNPGGTMRTV